MKYDSRDGKYKLFETNPRQGRSSYYVTAAGYNLAVWLVEDVIEKKDLPLTLAQNEHLWLQVPKRLVRQYLPSPELQTKVRELVKAGKCTQSLFYKPDLSPSRRMKLTLNLLNHYRKYKRYYGKKGLEE